MVVHHHHAYRETEVCRRSMRAMVRAASRLRKRSGPASIDRSGEAWG